MKRLLFATSLLLALAAGAFAQAPAAGRTLPPGREGREAARECFDLAQRIRACPDAEERAALTALLREKVSARRAARIEADKLRIGRAEREIAERHAAALRTLEAIRRRVLDAEARQAEDADREVDALLSGKEGFPPRGPDAHFGFCRRAPRPEAGDAPAAPSGPAPAE